MIDLADFGAIVDQILRNLLILLTSLASLALLAGAVIIANAVAPPCWPQSYPAWSPGRPLGSAPSRCCVTSDPPSRQARDGRQVGSAQLSSGPVVHSPDRRYWWDGQEWQLAVSPDGHQWFDGTRWIPNPLAPPRVWYRPTRWTKPLQVAVIAVTVIAFTTFVWTVALMVSTVPAPVVLIGDVSPAQAAQLSQSFRASMIAGLVVNGVVLLALVVLIVAGALKRWRWMFWFTLVGFGLFLTEPLVGLFMSVLIRIPRPPAGTIPPVPTFPWPFAWRAC